MPLTFDQAVELLEIVDVSAHTASDMPRIEKKNKSRWHPDKISNLKNPNLTAEYTKKFQQVEEACKLILSIIDGSCRAGDAYNHESGFYHEEPEAVLRRNAVEIQSSFASVWSTVKEKKYKHEEKKIIVSDGFVLRDLLKRDFDEDIAMQAILSFVSGSIILSIFIGIGNIISPFFGVVISVFLLVHLLCCGACFLPLARFWMPEEWLDFSLKVMSYGLNMYNWTVERSLSSGKWWLQLVLIIPGIFAGFLKYFFLWPLYESTKIFVGDKIVGSISKNVNYYAGAADWYIDELLSKKVHSMTTEELFHLSQLNSDLSPINR